MTFLQYLFLVFLLLVGVAVIPWSVERAVDKRWAEIRLMFDRALIHGESLDTLKSRLRSDSEVTKRDAAEALRQASGAVEALDLLHRKVRRLEEHPILRKLGGSGDGEGSVKP